jgi:ferritin
MLGEKMLTLLNDQIGHEMYSSNMYLAMAAYFEAERLPGFAQWLRVQAGEEHEHAMKFFDFVVDRGGRVKLGALAEPPFEWASPLDAFEKVLFHEQKVTSLIHTLFAAAVEEKDYPSQVMLHWFINEQVEEEKNAQAIVDQLSMMEDHLGGLLNLDHHIGKRGAD